MEQNAKPKSGRTFKYVGCIVFACVAALLTAVPVFGQAPRTYTLVGAGDIALCGSNGDEATARLVSKVPGTVFTLGDNVQDRGTASEFTDCYKPSWGRFKSRTRPAVGNHEYYTAGASPYYDYFGRKAGAAGRGYYAYKKGGWLVVVLNSNCEIVGCGPDSPQVAWLRKKLANDPARCTVAMFHHPLFSTNAPTPEVRTFWNLLYKDGADIILNGHAHSYERFLPQKPNGAKAPNKGIRQFVVGTGGTRPLRPFEARPKNSVVRNDQTFGALKLKLKNGSYNWKFLPVAGESFTDSGGAKCH